MVNRYHEWNEDCFAFEKKRGLEPLPFMPNDEQKDHQFPPVRKEKKKREKDKTGQMISEEL